MGLVVNEALAFGLWVIVSDQVGARELIVNDSVGETFQAGSVEGLVQAMQNAAAHLIRTPVEPVDPTEAMLADLQALAMRPSDG